MEVATKPPTQVAGVVGIEPAPVMSPMPPAFNNWSLLMRVPPFQMYARSLWQSELDDLAHANRVITDARSAGESDELWASYCAWHEAKGCWQNETPLGELKG